MIFDTQALTVPHVLQESARRFPHNMAIIDGTVRLTYADLEMARQRSAAAFLAAGLEKGDRVALLAPNTAEWIIVALGLQSVGGILLPLNTRFKGREMARILNQSRARFLVLVKSFLDNAYKDMLQKQEMPHLERMIFLSGGEEKESWKHFLTQGKPFHAQAQETLKTLEPDATSDLIFTSGTTGEPKGVMCTHRQTVETFRIYSDLLGLKKDDRYLVVSPFFHSFGYKAGWLACLLRGSCIYPWKVFDAKKVLSFILQHKITALPAAPAVFQSFFMLEGFKNDHLASINIICIGGAMVPESVVKRLYACGCRCLLKGYGLTETSGVISLSQEGDSTEKIVTTCGRPIRGVEVVCRDEQGHDLAVGKQGEIFVKGFNVMSQYYENPKATDEVLDAQGWLATGDIGFLDKQGYLTVCDRKKDMVVVGGLKCYPLEVEKYLLEHPDIVDVAVVKKEDQRLGEVPQAFIILARDAPKRSLAEWERMLIAWSREHMANYKVPRSFTILKELPRNPSGKVQKFKLTQMT